MLRRLELQGFKTFATRTVLDLEPGVTAVVGPNGSGKSNLTEAVRWVLGEQGMRAIRSRKTEDVIFAGSGRRAAAGMAEVTVTLDNSAGSLPLPFAEVSVTRRAYRSGENEYLINGERARLRDVTDLLSRAGLAANGHVVVGQGLVDAALSARPEERRTLFEDAAGISHHQARLADSRDKLTLTEANLARVADIAAEIAPRLPGLAKQAERARQALALRAELDSLLFGWYSQSWRELRGKHERLAAEHSATVADTTRAVEGLAAIDTRAVALAAQRDESRRDLAAREGAARELLALSETLRRDLTGARERQSALGARVAETERDLAEADAIRAADEAALQTATRSLGHAEATLVERTSALGAIEAESAERPTARRARESRLRAADSEANRAALAAAEMRARADGIGERRRSTESQLSKLRLGGEALAAMAAEAAARRRDAESALARIGEEIDSLAAQRGATDDALAAARSRQQSIATERGDLERQLRQLEARRDLLIGWRESQGGYYSGVRAVLQAARRPAVAPGPNRPSRLDGVVGPVGELVEVPANLETAIETALGGHLQDVVVERWEHAEAAIEMLKSTGAGRATFLPLDTLRPSGARPPAQGPGVLGVARDLVGFDARLAVVFDSLLGHTLVVEDLPTARRVLRQLIGGWQIVTVAGEIVRTSGAVTGGSQSQAQRGVLARERELRQAPAQIEKVAEMVRGKAAELIETRGTEQEAISALTTLRRREADLAAQRRTQEGALGVRRREEVACEQRAQLHTSEEGRLVLELARLDAEAAKGGEAISAAEARARQLASALESLRAEQAEADERDREHAQAISERRAARAVADAERRAAQSEVERRSHSAARATRLVSERESRLSDLRHESARLGSTLAAGEAELTAAEELAGEARAGIAPAAARLAGLEARAKTLELALVAARSALDAARERERGATLLAERARLECAGIVRQIELDLGPAEEIDGRLLLQVAGASVELSGPVPDLPDPAGRIQELRRALRGAGSASPEVIAEYESAKARHEFLTTQTRDLEAAAETLRQAIGDLEETMRRRFLATLDAVGEVFARNFTRLFGGGAAALGLTLPERPAESGIEITVQLPGKRGRNLAQLSGGERALTAVALIFALLEVNPTPFCVFDEVDAALDEANIDRFCDLLRERSQLTQFVVITHNRRTMEAASALYGLSMEDRSVSRVFSLKLAEAR